MSKNDDSTRSVSSARAFQILPHLPAVPREMTKFDVIHRENKFFRLNDVGLHSSRPTAVKPYQGILLINNNTITRPKWYMYPSITHQGALKQDPHNLFAQQLFRARRVEFPRYQRRGNSSSISTLKFPSTYVRKSLKELRPIYGARLGF